MSKNGQEQPYQQLGESLKNIRQKLNETVSEVSGAVEIDDTELNKIEQGQMRPSEDILMLLISHFNIREEEADKLWDLAGYDRSRMNEGFEGGAPQPKPGQGVMLVMAVDPRIIFSDGVQIQANSHDVIMSFGQAINTPQALTTAKIGMSRAQAFNVLQALGDALSRSEPRQLSEGGNSEKANKPKTTDQ